MIKETLLKIESAITRIQAADGKEKTELIARGTALPDVGVSGVVDTAVFALNQGDVSAPIATESAVVAKRRAPSRSRPRRSAGLKPGGVSAT